MAENFVQIDSNTPILLPMDLRDWVEDNDLVHFILEVVSEIPDQQASVNLRGTGSAYREKGFERHPPFSFHDSFFTLLPWPPIQDKSNREENGTKDHHQ